MFSSLRSLFAISLYFLTCPGDNPLPVAAASSEARLPLYCRRTPIAYDASAISYTYFSTTTALRKVMMVEVDEGGLEL